MFKGKSCGSMANWLRSEGSHEDKGGFENWQAGLKAFRE